MLIDPSMFQQTIWSLLPPVIAIGLALITKEVYSSLFLGVLCGGLLYSGFSFEGTILHIFNDGIVSVLSDAYNVGILVFLVFLGILVSLMNKAGGSKAFGKWASKHIKSRVGAQLATMLLGICIFVDDYFNCLTVGSVMRPVTDEQSISRAKLAYLIDATAAPVCIIAPVSSWAAAVSGFVEDGGFSLFIKAIPYNYYALLTIAMMIFISVFKVDYGPMREFEYNAEVKGDIFSGRKDEQAESDINSSDDGKVCDLIIPVLFLIAACVTGMVYSGGFFTGTDFITSFSQSDASVGLMLGSAITLVFTLIFYLLRGHLKFTEMMKSVPDGFKAMVSPILILTLAWSLKAMTDSLGAKDYVANIVRASAAGYQTFLPAIVFVIGCFLSFATGTSWGTFGILIPITIAVFPANTQIGIICVSACMAGAVCGDHCSPISDTTIMASAGAQCDHVVHVSTQLPYAITVAVISFLSYLSIGFLPNPMLALPVGIILLIVFLLLIKLFQRKK